MHPGSLETGRIIEAFRRNVPDTYVRDYRANGGYIVICKNYRTIKWRDQTTTSRVERQVPAITLVNLPGGFVTAATRYVGVRLVRPGWREQFRKAMPHLTMTQMRRITKELGAREVFPGVS